jgi:RNA polymerase sigma-70 factor (ECF subfamily)
MDPEVVMRAQHGDEAAFESITVASYPRLYRIAYGILREHGAADDAAQQTLVDIWRRLPRLRDPERFDGWSYRLLVHACYAEAKRQPKWLSGEAIGPSIEPRAPDPFGGVLDQDQLERAFRGLSVEHRVVIVLRYLLDLPLGQVAEALGIPVGTVGSRLHRALDVLRAEVEAADRPVAAPVNSEGRS